MDSRNERLSHAQRLLEAIEAGDDRAEREAADAIARRQSLYLHDELHRIAGELREALCNVHVAGELARLAHRELPDAQLRLNQVIGLTEDAAHRTLAAVEASLPLADGMAEAVTRFREARPRLGADGGVEKALEALLDRIVADAGQLKSRLSEVMMAQSFQDITGQIVGRVVGLVADLEDMLGRTGADESAASPGAGLRERHARAGFGPSLPGVAGAGCVDQQDVDDLLSELGV